MFFFSFLQKYFETIPENRRLDDKEQKEVAHLVNDLGAKKRLVQENIYVKTQKKVLLKDIANIAAKSKKDIDGNNLQDVVNLLQKKYREY